MKPDFIAVSVLQRFPILELRAPGQDRVAEIQFLHENSIGRFNLGGSLARRLENGGVVPPDAKDRALFAEPTWSTLWYGGKNGAASWKPEGQRQ